jgi:aminoglycoside phosphotransferase (APT) family kinase protein
VSDPLDALAILRDALLRSFPQWSPDEVSLTPLAGGITNRNAIVSVASESRTFVARLPGERTELLGIDRANESEAALRAAALGIGPPVLGELDGIGTLVTELVPGSHLDSMAFVERLDDVVSLIRRFHDSGPLAGGFPIHRVVEWHARDASAHGVPLPPEHEPLRALSGRIEEAFQASPDDPVACHNDLLPANVLFGSERAWLLDFEYAGMNDRYFDLANLSINCGLDDTADAVLLETYDGAVNARNHARLTLMKVMSEYREGMWAVVQQAISTLDTDFVSYATERLSSGLALAGALDLDAALQAAAAPSPT